jgi:hypothetical protein
LDFMAIVVFMCVCVYVREREFYFASGYEVEMNRKLCKLCF